MPRLGEAGVAAHERAQPRLGDVVAARGDVAGCEIEDARGLAVRMVHPGVPDALLGVERLVARRGREAREQGINGGVNSGGPPAAPGGDQVEDVDESRHLAASW